MKKIIVLVTVLFSSLSLSIFSISLLPSNNFISLIEPHSIKGIDVSHHQGKIDWAKVKNDNIRFAFIKSTEGATFQDSCFSYNAKEAKKQGIKIGAYHYFKLTSEAEAQFANFVARAPKDLLDLPPVIDLEYCQNKEMKLPEHKAGLDDKLKKLEKLMHQHYGVKPIFYTTYDYYIDHIKGNFDNEIWICSTQNKRVTYLEEQQWRFRQYSFHGKINGIDKEVDLDFFKGSEEDFNNLCKKNK
jgi:lysozyme